MIYYFIILIIITIPIYQMDRVNRHLIWEVFFII